MRLFSEQRPCVILADIDLSSNPGVRWYVPGSSCMDSFFWHYTQLQLQDGDVDSSKLIGCVSKFDHVMFLFSQQKNKKYTCKLSTTCWREGERVDSLAGWISIVMINILGIKCHKTTFADNRTILASSHYPNINQGLSCNMVSPMANSLNHWGWVMHICIGNLTIIGSDNGLSPGRRQAIIWTNAGILLTIFLETNFSEILIEIHIFSLNKMYLKMSSV